MDEIKLKLPYPNFYLSFHIDPFKGDHSLRELTYTININHKVRTLVVDIEEPLRSTDFSVLPEAAEVKEDDGLKHHWFNFENPDKDVNAFTFKISYKKSDNRPSVDIKYSPMSMKMEGRETAVSHSLEKRSFMDILYVLAGSGLILLAVMVWFIFRKKKVE